MSPRERQRLADNLALVLRDLEAERERLLAEYEQRRAPLRQQIEAVETTLRVMGYDGPLE